MAKKKTYRKKPVYTPKKPVKKPPMAKNTKIALLVGAGIVVVAIVLFFALYSDGSLPTKRVMEGEGATATYKNVVAVPENENWVIINKGTSSKPKYYNLGALTIPDGYGLDDAFATGSDANVKQYHCVPEDDDSPINYVHVQGVPRLPQEIAAEALDNYSKFYAESENSEIMTTDIDGVTATYFTSKFGAEDDNGVTKYHQSMTMYLPAVRESSLLINIMAPVASLEDGLAPDVLMGYAQEMAKGFTPAEK